MNDSREKQDPRPPARQARQPHARRHPAALRRAALARLRAGEPLDAVAALVGVDIRTLRRWFAAEGRAGGAATEGALAELLRLVDAVPVGLYQYRLDPDGQRGFVYASRAVRTLLDLPRDSRPEDISPSLTYADEAGRAAVLASIQESARTLAPWTMEFAVRDRSGGTRWLRGDAIPRRTASGTVIWDGVFTDITARQAAEEALQSTEARLQHIAANVPGAIFRYVIHPDGSDSMLYVSAGCLALFEIDAGRLAGSARAIWEMIDPADIAHVQETVQASATTLTPWRCGYRITTPSGKRKWLHGGGVPHRRDNGDVVWDTVVVDVTDLRLAEEALRESETRYRLLAENVNDLVCLHDGDGRYVYASPSAHDLLGYAPGDLVGTDYRALVHPEDRDRVARELRAVSGDADPVTFRMRRHDGGYVWLETLAREIPPTAGQPGQVLTTSRDISERVRAEEQLRHTALHDALTGLPNRLLLGERLELALRRMRRDRDARFAVLFLDMDRFKVVNDSLGHAAGDHLLMAVARRLAGTVRGTDLVARLGGDEFVVLLDDFDNAQEPVRTAERIVELFRTPFEVGNGEREIYVTLSVGVALGTAEYAQAPDVLRDANIAMYRAKSSGRDRIAVFDADMHRQAVRRMQIESDLRRALGADEFVVHYQPILELGARRLVGFEALVRWQHRDRGLVPPAEFVPVAEETGLIAQLDRRVLLAACEQLVAWQRRHPAAAGLRVNVNLSALDLQRPALVEEVQAVLARTGLDSRCLTLEITESMLVEDVPATIGLLERLKAVGIRIAIDDFGTGFSSLAYLHSLPVDALKVDGAFVRKMDAATRNQRIVETIIALSDRLGLDAVAEGIENEAQIAELQRLGCEFGQGYLFARPQPPAEAERWVLTL